ncbi:hypothetical protein [Nocardioides sp. KR10-350]|uniref:hypothetical protein n=1 Tax=Nocardioides cheoyonin TaxID=3156615 RepID=UPI0032B5D4D9
MNEADPELGEGAVAALAAAVTGDGVPLTELADEVLAAYGGRLRDGFRLAGQGPAPQGPAHEPSPA